eukprot:SAG31_NODE_22399_length_526_cov_1.388759_1_plen_81_part_10
MLLCHLLGALLLRFLQVKRLFVLGVDHVVINIDSAAQGHEHGNADADNASSLRCRIHSALQFLPREILVCQTRNRAAVKHT